MANNIVICAVTFMAIVDISAVLKRYTIPTVLSGSSGAMGSSTDHITVEPLTSMCSTAPVVGMDTTSSAGLSLAKFQTYIKVII